MTTLEALEKRRERLLEEIKSLGDMRRGTLVERYIPCGKKNCHCKKPGSKGHGPAYSFTHKVKGKTQTKYFNPKQAELVREQIENRKRFSTLSNKFLEVNEEICHLRLETWQPEESDAKKNFTRKSKRKYRRKSNES